MKPAARLETIPPYPFAAIARAKMAALAAGADIIDLSIGDPDLGTPAHIVAALKTAVDDKRTHRYDETGSGLPEFRQAVAQWMQRRFGIALDVDTEVLRLIGSKEGLAHLLWALAGPGDVVLYPDPGYPVYRVNASLAGAEGYPVPLTAANGWRPDFAAIPSDVAKRARVLLMCYPHMPTGAVIDEAGLREMVAFARQHDLVLAYDHAYSEITYDGYLAPSPLQNPEARDCTIEFHSLSKGYRMTGWRIGWACGGADIIAALWKLKSNIDSGVFLAIQRAAVTALTGPQDCLDENRRVYRERRDIIVSALNAAGWKLEAPRGAMYVWAPTPKGLTSAEFCERALREAAVVFTPGAAFGAQGEGWFRVALSCTGGTERVREAMQRITDKLPVICRS